MSIERPPPRKRERFRFTLSAMMIVVLIVGGGFGWLASRARVQRDAVALITQHRGVVAYDWQIKPGPQPRQPPGPQWLRDLIGPDALDTVVLAGFATDAKLDDRTMAAIGQLSRLESLDLPGSGLAEVTPDGFAHLRALRLQQLSASGRGDTTGFLAVIDGQAQLKRLLLEGAQPTDADMARIGKLVTLESLTINGRQLSDEGFAHLSTLKNLKNLAVLGKHFANLSCLSGLTNLEDLELGDHEAVGESLPVLSIAPLFGLYQLRSLTLSDYPVARTDLEGIAGLRALGSLNLMGADLDDAALERISRLTSLQSVAFRGQGISDAGLANLARLPYLINLQLDRTSVRDFSAMGPALKTISGLIVSRSPISDDSLAVLKGAAKLRVLHLRDVPITDAGLLHVAAIPLLVSLYLDDTAITDTGLANLRGMTSLLTLSLKGTKITDAGLVNLSKMTMLTLLNLEGTAITDVGLEALVKGWRPGRITINVAGTAITDAAIERILKAAPQTTITRELSRPY